MYTRASLSIALLLCVTVSLLIPFQSCAAELQSIKFGSGHDQPAITLNLDKKTRYTYKLLPAGNGYPDRCYVDLYNTARGAKVPGWQPLEDSTISRIRTGVHATKLRVVFDMRNSGHCEVDSSESPFQILISVSTEPVVVEPNTGFSRTELEEKSIDNKVPAATADLNKPPQTKLASLQNVQTSANSINADGATPQPTVLTDSSREKFSMWGWIQLFSAQDTNNDPAEDEHFFRTTARSGAEQSFDLGPDYEVQARASIELDRLFYANTDASDETEVKLHESYLQLHNTNWDLSFGKQRVRWGKSDQLSPVDSINPQDMRQFINIDMEDRAMPSWLLRGRWFGDKVAVETIVQPWFEKSEFEYFDSDWALFRNLRQSITSSPTIPVGLKNIAREIKTQETAPNSSLENSSAALRLHWQTDQTDYALSYHYGWESLPTITSFPVKGINYTGDPKISAAELLSGAGVTVTGEAVKADFRRQQTAGFEWETVIDPIGFRGEIASINKISFLTSRLTSKRKLATHLVSGIDYTSENEWYFNLQGSWLHIHGHDDDILYFEKNNVAALGEIRKPVFRGRADFSIQYNYTITDQSSYLKPAIRIKAFETIECEIGAMIFSGDGDTLLGSHDQADQVFGIIKYTF